MDLYALGGGAHDLADRLGIQSCESLALSGSCNSRIIRTTAKHAYHNNNRPTFYLLGMSFMNRWEIPVCPTDDKFEGTWINPQSKLQEKYLGPWTQEKTHEWADLNFDAHVYGMLDMLENLSYQLLSLKLLLAQNGHRLLVFRQINDHSEQEMLQHLADPRLDIFGDPMLFVDRYCWSAVHWQHQQGVPESAIRHDPPPPPHFRHRRPGHHARVNEYLTDYIKHNTILE
jgi:hypothetical protein